MFKALRVVMALITQSKGLPTVSYKAYEIENDEGTRANILQKSNPGNQLVARSTHLENDPFEPVNLLAPVTQSEISTRSSRAISTQQLTGTFSNKIITKDLIC